MPQRLLISEFVFTAVIGSLIPAHSAEPATTPRRPNILWITCEDISPDLGCYGNDFASTPALDRLARQGVRYLNAYGITGVCAPNRSCLNVRIAAAEALCDLNGTEDAVPVLIEGLRHQTAFIRLRSMNVLDRLGRRARPALPAMKPAAMKTKSHVGDYLSRMVQYVPERLEQP